MNKKEIEYYLKRIDELGAKLTGEDKKTYAWLIYCCNQCAKLLNETEEQCKRQKEVIDKAIEELKKGLHELDTRRREEVYIEQYIEEALNILIKANDKIYQNKPTKKQEEKLKKQFPKIPKKKKLTREEIKRVQELRKARVENIGLAIMTIFFFVMMLISFYLLYCCLFKGVSF